jgi:hypothetical protein
MMTEVEQSIDEAFTEAFPEIAHLYCARCYPIFLPLPVGAQAICGYRKPEVGAPGPNFGAPLCPFCDVVTATGAVTECPKCGAR